MSPTPSFLARMRSDQSGATIIEVMVSAMLVVMLSVGVLKGLDAANANSGNNKARAIAADLAQQDQERLRAFRARELSETQGETRTRTVSGVDYTVVSSAEWVTDSSGSRVCGNDDGRAEYLRIDSTVSWREMRGADPVTQTSIYAPPNGSFAGEGSLAVEVLDRDAAGVEGVAVTVDGPQDVSGTTDQDGCIFFGWLGPGNYQITISRPGYVDANGNNVVVRDVGVVSETTQVQAFEYDLAGGAQVAVDTKKGASASAQPASAQYVTFGHSQLLSPGTRTFGTGASQSSFAIGGLFPFGSPYAVYSGNCVGANPSNYAQQPVNLAVPQGGTPPAVTVREPAFQVYKGSNPLKNKVVKLTPRASGCSTVITGRTDNSNTPWFKQDPSSAGDYGVPYGIYDVCANDTSSKKLVRTNVTIADPNGGTVVTLPTSQQNGQC